MQGAPLPPWPGQPRLEWEPSPFGSIEHTPVYPPMRKLPDGRLMVDHCMTSDGPQMKAWKKEDHPMLDVLREKYPNLPRAVAAPYKAERILARMRSTEAWSILREMDEWEKAWNNYMSAIKPEEARA